MTNGVSLAKNKSDAGYGFIHTLHLGFSHRSLNDCGTLHPFEAALASV